MNETIEARRNWVRKKRQNPFRSFGAWLLHVVNRLVPEIRGYTVWQSLSDLLAIAAFVVPITAPVWMKYVLNEEISLNSGIVIAVILLASQFIPSLRRLLRRANTLDGYKADIAEQKMHLFNEMKFRGNWSKDRQQILISEVLSIMKSELLLAKKRVSRDDYRLTVLLYEGTRNEKLRLAFSSRGNMTTQGTMATDLIAHYVAEKNMLFAIWNLPGVPNDLFPFVRKKLSTAGKPRYKSIWFIPLDYPHPNDPSRKVVKAVLSIDSGRSYEFWGTTDNELYAIRPMITVLKRLLEREKHYIDVID